MEEEGRLADTDAGAGDNGGSDSEGSGSDADDSPGTNGSKPHATKPRFRLRGEKRAAGDERPLTSREHILGIAKVAAVCLPLVCM